MSTLQPPSTREFPSESIEKQVYSIVEKYKAYIPIENDRNRLGFYLYKYILNEGEPPIKSIPYSKVLLRDITKEELADKLQADLDQISK
ncbi:MAG: hypothetical protein GX452_09785 [Ignavibacteriales bacterium]|jgi:hypothetical protein|nr:hypothetical protein [Ignavibacteriaceae bacterium]NLH61681.1 hypothetical protein [Ignavibacteriales bacterium]HOJ18693.1 hypothetical protein [Ignavibacteriaceae bacterium]HPO55173.1 hypothetical protein [Ignavibacteriaceae bacterium]